MNINRLLPAFQVKNFIRLAKGVPEEMTKLESYPFDKPFKEVIIDLEKWAKEIITILMKGDK